MASVLIVSWWLTSLILAASCCHAETSAEFKGSPSVNPDNLDHASSSKTSNATAPGSSSRGSGGVNVLAAMLVTASSIMVFMAFRFSICRQCGGSPDVNDHLDLASVEDLQIEEMINGSGRATDLEQGSNRVTKGLGSLGLALDSIDRFTLLVDYEKLAAAMAANTDKCCCCSVCLCEFKASAGEEVRYLPGCKHFFHPDCVDLWLAAQKSCPVCRGSVIPVPVETAPSRVSGVESFAQEHDSGGGGSGGGGGQDLVLQVDNTVA